MENFNFAAFLPEGTHCEKTPGMQRWVLFVERILPIAILGMAAVGVPVMMLAPEGVPRLRALSKELAQVEGENAELRQHIQHLRGRVRHLREDPVAVERIARDELAYVRPGEVPFVVTNLPPASTPAPALEAPDDASSARRRGVLGRIWDAFARAAHTIR